jgi:hypothetical protein
LFFLLFLSLVLREIVVSWKILDIFKFRALFLVTLKAGLAWPFKLNFQTPTDPRPANAVNDYNGQ